MMEDKQPKEPIIVRLISPARPLLTRSGSPLHSIYQQRFDELPMFQHIQQEDEQLLHNGATLHSNAEKRSYTVYRRNISETWNFTVMKQQPISTVDPLPATGEHILHFQSNFESGNLKQADKIWGEEEYNLTMQKDINTYGFTQWFFFKVTNAIPNRQYKFNLTNFYKQASLYQKGMRILVYSLKENFYTKKGWYRDGTDIQYYQNDTSEVVGEGRTKMYYTLSFTYTFRHTDDEVFFAHNYPYTYTELMSYLDQLENQCRSILYRSTLTRTLAMNRVQILTITNFMNNRPKKGIFITGRTHPGQTVSSYIVKGVIDYLTSDDESAFQLRDNFIFKIVPMVNPDGVIHGNYRSNLSGSDLNRKWQTPNKRLHSQIFHLKKTILEFAQRTPVLMFCDMHGHSRKKNAFIYGCADKSNPYKTRQFPFLVSKASKSFSFEDCTFGIKNDKKGTARAVLWKKLSIPNIFTLETSFCGPAHPEVHFGYRHFEEIGKRFCETLLVHFQDELRSDLPAFGNTPPNVRLGSKRKDFLDELYSNQKYIDMGVEPDESDSSPSVDEMSERTIMKLEKGVQPLPRTLIRQQKSRQRTPVLSRTRRNLMVERAPRSKVKIQRKHTPDTKKDQILQNRSLYRDKECEKLPYMYLQPKMFTIVEPQPRNNPWTFNNYQQHLSHKTTHQTLVNNVSTFSYKSHSFANRRSLKMYSPRQKPNTNHKIDLRNTIVSGINDDKRTNRRVKTEAFDQPRITTLDFEVRLRHPKSNTRPNYYLS